MQPKLIPVFLFVALLAHSKYAFLRKKLANNSLQQKSFYKKQFLQEDIRAASVDFLSYQQVPGPQPSKFKLGYNF